MTICAIHRGDKMLDDPLAGGRGPKKQIMSKRDEKGNVK